MHLKPSLVHPTIIIHYHTTTTQTCANKNVFYHYLTPKRKFLCVYIFLPLTNTNMYIKCVNKNNIIIKICKISVKYVGETYRSLKERLSEHLRDIRHECNPPYAPPPVVQKGPTTVARHFGRNQHTRDDLKVQILELIRLDPLGPHTDAYHETREHF